MLYFFSPQSSRSTNYENNVINDPKVKGVIKKSFIPVKINMDTERQLAGLQRGFVQAGEEIVAPHHRFLQALIGRLEAVVVGDLEVEPGEVAVVLVRAAGDQSAGVDAVDIAQDLGELVELLDGDALDFFGIAAARRPDGSLRRLPRHRVHRLPRPELRRRPHPRTGRGGRQPHPRHADGPGNVDGA